MLTCGSPAHRWVRSTLRIISLSCFIAGGALSLLIIPATITATYLQHIFTENAAGPHRHCHAQQQNILNCDAITELLMSQPHAPEQFKSKQSANAQHPHVQLLMSPSCHNARGALSLQGLIGITKDLPALQHAKTTCATTQLLNNCCTTAQELLHNCSTTQRPPLATMQEEP